MKRKKENIESEIKEMFDFSEAKIEKLIIHQVGNKLKDEPLVLSDIFADITDCSLTNLIERYFFQRFKDNGQYSFGHETDLAFNEIYQYSKNIFHDPNELETNSRNIATHLYKVSTHPNIKNGELYIAYFSNAIFNNQHYNAIGIFKSETKEPFLKINNKEKNVTLSWETGVDTRKLDKGCIVFNNGEDVGYSVLIVDSGNHIDTKYWIQDFLGIEKNDSSFYKTKIVVDACKQYLKKDFQGATTEKVVTLNNVLNYIASNESLRLDEFSDKVTDAKQDAEQLKEYIQTFAEKKNFHDIQIFEMDQAAVKTIKNTIKNIIKLDTAFEIKVKASSELDKKHLEKGYDEDKRMHYYKIYFNEEQ
ncbi:MAG: nucleoid-associated protein [Thermincolia bacterium]